jgi:hypothetical protein
MVVFNNGDIEAYETDELYDFLEDALQAEGDYDTTDGSVLDSILVALSTVLAEQQEQGLVDVYEGGFLDTATGQSLERVVSVLGLDRRSAINATGAVTFSHGSITDATYSIPSGTTVETAGGTEFTTTEVAEIPFWDDFEGVDPLANYSGDTASYEISQTYAKDGSNSLHATAAGNIWLDGGFSTRGQEHVTHLYFDSGDGGTQQATFRLLGEASNLAAGYDIVISADNNELSWEGGSVSSATIPSDEWLELHATVELDGSQTATLYDASGSEITTATKSAVPDYPDLADHDGTIGFGANSSAVYWDYAAAVDTTADIRAVEGGTVGNVAANAITTLPSPVTGVNDVTNTQAVGEEDLYDTDGQRQVSGTPEETDEELRERAERVSGDGGAATIDALLGSVLDVDGVTSARIFENDTDTDNTGTGGLPPVSFEMVVNGGDDGRIAEAIFEEKAATARDYGGANGTNTSAFVDAVNDQSFEIFFSRPTVVNVDTSLDIVVTDEYAGDRAVRKAVTDYVGGTGVDGEAVDGLTAGEDVIINELESRIQQLDGIVGVDSSDSTYTPSTVSDSNGLEVVSIGDNEVAETDGTDGSISITTTEV